MVPIWLPVRIHDRAALLDRVDEAVARAAGAIGSYGAVPTWQTGSWGLPCL